MGPSKVIASFFLTFTHVLSLPVNSRNFNNFKTFLLYMFTLPIPRLELPTQKFPPRLL